MKLIKCDICDLPLLLTDGKKPSQGPEVQAHVKHWCDGFCLSVDAIVAIAHDGISRIKVRTPEGRRIRTKAIKKIEWLAEEIRIDLRVQAQRSKKGRR